MTITEFCKNRNVDSQAVRKYIRRHPEEFLQHTGKRGREITLDAVALDKLDKKYPLVKPVQVIDGVDPKEYAKVLNDLNDAKDELIKINDIKARLEIELSNAHAEKFLLEEKKNSEIERLKKEHEDAIYEMQQMHEKTVNLQKLELEAEKTRKLPLGEAIKRVFKRE